MFEIPSAAKNVMLQYLLFITKFTNIALPSKKVKNIKILERISNEHILMNLLHLVVQKVHHKNR